MSGFNMIEKMLKITLGSQFCHETFTSKSDNIEEIGSHSVLTIRETAGTAKVNKECAKQMLYRSLNMQKLCA